MGQFWVGLSTAIAIKIALGERLRLRFVGGIGEALLGKVYTKGDFYSYFRYYPSRARSRDSSGNSYKNAKTYTKATPKTQRRFFTY